MDVVNPMSSISAASGKYDVIDDSVFQIQSSSFRVAQIH